MKIDPWVDQIMNDAFVFGRILLAAVVLAAIISFGIWFLVERTA